MNIFEQASRQKLTFSSDLGELTTDQLWDLPIENPKVSTHRGPQTDLDTIGRRIKRAIREEDEDSIVSTKPKSKKVERLNLQLQIIEHIVISKQDDLEKRKEDVAISARREALLAELSRKKNAELEGKTIEEIEKELNELAAK